MTGALGSNAEVAFFCGDGLVMPLSEDEMRDAVEAVLSVEEVDRPCAVSVSLVDMDKIRALNAEWRDIDAPTDVLSFECDSPWDEGIPADESVELGDIVLAPQVIARQAPEFGNTPREEFLLMLVHGMFHLLGYDHMCEEDALEMEARELEAMQLLALERGEDPARVKIGPTTRHIDD